MKASAALAALALNGGPADVYFPYVDLLRADHWPRPIFVDLHNWRLNVDAISKRCVSQAAVESGLIEKSSPYSGIPKISGLSFHIHPVPNYALAERGLMSGYFARENHFIREGSIKLVLAYEFPHQGRDVLFFRHRSGAAEQNNFDSRCATGILHFDQKLKDYREIVYDDRADRVGATNGDPWSVRGVEFISGERGLSLTGQPKLVGGHPKNAGKDCHYGARERGHKTTVFVSKDERSPEDGRDNIVVGTLVWAAIFALAAYLGVMGSEYWYRRVVDRERNRYRRQQT